MNMTLILIMLSVAAGFMYWGVRQKRTVGIVLGIVLAGGTFLFFSFLSFLSDAVWFESLGFAGRFWKLVLFRAAFAAIGGCLGCAALWLMTVFLFARKQARYRWIPAVIGLYLGAQWGAVNWDVILLYLNGTTAAGPGAVPDKGFYLFALPFYEQVYVLLLGLCLAGVVCIFGGLFMTFKNGRVDLSLLRLKNSRHYRQLSWVSVNIALFLMVLGWGHSLERFHLSDSDGAAAEVVPRQEFTHMAGLDDAENGLFSSRLPVGSDPQWNADPGMYCAEQMWEIKNRVKTLAPFLYFNDEPYLVLAEGRLYWMLNASTVSSDSYSRPFLNLEAAYQRSGLFHHTPKMYPERTALTFSRISVLAAIDTDHGAVRFYICEPADPLIAVWNAIFPELFKHRNAMPESLSQHMQVRSYEQEAASAR
jgi:uncharacterized membrane protein (UPF0182 family)